MFYKVCFLNKSVINVKKCQIKSFQVIKQFFEKQQVFLYALLIRYLNLQFISQQLSCFIITLAPNISNNLVGSTMIGINQPNFILFIADISPKLTSLSPSGFVNFQAVVMLLLGCYYSVGINQNRQHFLYFVLWQSELLPYNLQKEKKVYFCRQKNTHNELFTH